MRWDSTKWLNVTTWVSFSSLFAVSTSIIACGRQGVKGVCTRPRIGRKPITDGSGLCFTWGRGSSKLTVWLPWLKTGFFSSLFGMLFEETGTTKSSPKVGFSPMSGNRTLCGLRFGEESYKKGVKVLSFFSFFLSLKIRGYIKIWMGYTGVHVYKRKVVGCDITDILKEV